MDWNRIEGSWKQTSGKLKEKWGKLTDDDLTQINGKREQFEGKIRWQGEVEIFALHGHPEARYCYAWSYLDDNQIEQHTAVLEIPPVDSPRNAVRAAIAAQGKARSNKGHEP